MLGAFVFYGLIALSVGGLAGAVAAPVMPAPADRSRFERPWRGYPLLVGALVLAATAVAGAGDLLWAAGILIVAIAPAEATFNGVRRMRPRFSLRWLFILTALVALASALYVLLPWGVLSVAIALTGVAAFVASYEYWQSGEYLKGKKREEEGDA